MRTLLIPVACMALLTGCANVPNNACTMEIKATFNSLKATAISLAPANGREYLSGADLRLRSGMTRQNWDGSYSELDGKVVYHTADVYIDAIELCKGPKAVRDRVVAHELGHLLSYVTLPDIRQGSRYATPETVEVWGNEYGAKIFKAAGFDSNKYLEITDAKCSQGSKYFCDQAQAWRYGLNH